MLRFGETRRYLYWVIASVLLLAARLAYAATPEVTVPLLRVGPDYFTNATITPLSSTHVNVLHSRGMTMAKAEDLDPDLQRKLGYDANHSKASATPPNLTQSKTSPASAKASWNTNSENSSGVPTSKPSTVADSRRVADKKAHGSAKLQILLEKVRARAREQEEDGGQVNERRDLNSIIQQIIGLGVLIAISVVYFLYCHACLQLCRRAGAPSTVLVWLPGFKKLALFRATSVSWWWFFLGFILPIISLIGWIICCSRLCQTFQRTRWWTLLMIWPMLGWPIFMFFAYTSREDDDEPAIRNLSQGYAF